MNGLMNLIDSKIKVYIIDIHIINNNILCTTNYKTLLQYYCVVAYCLRLFQSTTGGEKTKHNIIMYLVH